MTDYRLFLKKSRGVRFDLVFLDPPYRFTIDADIIRYLVENEILEEGAVIVSEQDYPNESIDGLSMKEYRYGQKHVAIYKKED